ncbi:MAG TPA: peptidylprolyl isomerase [Chitinophagaceae bacterium]|nr:peptidylprolyl isomerase [Chitinophagaceae bacterium]
MEQVKNGDTVKVHYHGRLTDGTTFDTSEGRGPLEFEVGAQQVIKGFDEGVLGMAVGEKKTIHIPAEDAYGSASDDNLIEFPRTQFPPDMNPEVGMQLNLRSQDGRDFPVVISEIREDIVVLDANHPLAGRDLVFDVEVVGIHK